MTLEPQSDFRKSEAARGWSDFFGSERFQQAALVALYELQRSLPKATTDPEAAINHWRLDGANRLLYVLMNLAESDRRVETTPKNANLKL